MYGNIGYVASEDRYYSSRLDEGEPLLNSIVEDRILCSTTDLFKMIVKLLFGSPSEIFSSKVEHVLVPEVLNLFQDSE